MIDLPHSLADVATDWVSKVLADTPRFANDPVEGMDIEPLGDGIGQLSELGILDLTHRSGAQNRVVLKLHTQVSSMHNLAIAYGVYEREVNFYRTLAGEIPMRTPEVYFAEHDASRQRVALIMELMEGWYSPDQLAGATREEIESAVHSLCALTAAYWNSPLKGQISWLGTSRSDYYQQSIEDYRSFAEPFIDRFADAMPASAPLAIYRIRDAMPALLDHLATGEYALAHWDYRVENMFFKTGSDDFAVIDWQLCMWMPPGWDFAYLVGTNLRVEDRRAWMDDLMELYLDGLRRHGISHYGRDDLLGDVRTCLLATTCVAIIGGANADPEKERSVELFRTLGQRNFSAIEDLDCLDVLNTIG